MQRQHSRQTVGLHACLRLLVACGLMLLPCLLRAEAWREESSKHFRVFYVDDAAFATAVAEWAEQYYTQITLELGLNHVVRRDYAPWLWERRCRIYLYPSRDAYLQATGSPAWSGGMVHYRQRVVYSFMGATSFLEKTLPHELTHILFREYVGFDNARVPRWVDEGVAQYAEIGRREEALDLMRHGVTQGVYVPLAQLQGLPVNHVYAGVAQLFYSQAVSLVHFFLSQYGSQRFIAFCSSLRDGHPIERALSFATAGSIRSLGEFEDAWRQFIFRLS